VAVVAFPESDPLKVPVVVPGSVGLFGMPIVIAPVEAETEIWLAVPASVVGRAVQPSELPFASTPVANEPEEQLVPLAARAIAVVAEIVPLPEADRLAPVPTTIAAEAFVPLVISLNAEDPPPPPDTVQSVRDCPVLSEQVTPDPIKFTVGLWVKATPSSAIV
jgi:hypothetical protein